MSTLERLFLNLFKGIRNGWNRLNRWIEEQQLIEIEGLTLNGPKDDCIPFR